jgi:mono/diheme cytochrome c family protein
MLKSALGGVLLTLAVLAAAAVVLIEIGFVPANADAAPSRLDTWAATTSLEATLKREAPKEPDPVTLTDENLVAGVRLFAQNCAVCHGNSKGLPAASPSACFAFHVG